MFFVELDDDGISLADIKRIAHHIVEDHKNLINQLDQKELDDLSFMLKPTLEADHNADEIYAHWEKFVDEFVVNDEYGNPMKFFTGDDGHLYFGDKAGMAMSKKLNKNPDYPTKTYNSNK